LIDTVGGGLLARPEPADLAARLMHALADPQAMRRAANEASRRVHERYTWAARAADLDQVYRELLPLELPERIMAVATGGRSF
jgi:glycosyltransferase involved in cell wall biosynthesis